MRIPTGRLLSRTMILMLAVAGVTWWSAGGAAGPITFSGTVAYTGNYSGDTLYVAVLDTMSADPEDIDVVVLKAYSVGAPPFNQPFVLDFDNTGHSPQLLVASLLDVDGDGTNSVSGADVFGWYNGGTEPAFVSAATSQAGLDFALPRSEIRGTLTFASGQTDARVNVSTDSACMMEGFRPNDPFLAPGAYVMAGIYPGTYCISASGNTMSGYVQICYGDPTCASPTLITLTDGEVRNNVDFDFAAGVPVVKTTWGRIKSLYP